MSAVHTTTAKHTTPAKPTAPKAGTTLAKPTLSQATQMQNQMASVTGPLAKMLQQLVDALKAHQDTSHIWQQVAGKLK